MKSNLQMCTLQQAVQIGDISALKKCLKSGDDANALDDNGEPLLFTPIVNGDIETLKFLLTLFDVNMTSDDGRTALMIAVEMNDMDMVKMLIKSDMDLRIEQDYQCFMLQRAQVESKDISGKTPLLLALDHGRFDIAEYLIKHGSDVNAVNELGQSALYFVVASDRKDCTRIVKILFHCGYLMKECDNWIGLEDIISNKMKEPKYMRMLHKMKVSLKTISRSGRLDKLIPCMNEERVQNFIFEDLRFASYQYIEYFKSNGYLPCSEIKKKYLDTIITLSMSCDNDGLEALLEILSELRIKLQDLIFTEIMPVGTSPKDFCLDAP